MAIARQPIRTALVVDDERLILEQYRNALLRAGNIEVLAASDVRSARAHLQTCRPDLAIIDLVLPDGSGIDLIAEMRQSNAAALLILVTGFGSIETAVHAMRAGADDVLPKPVRVAEILRRSLGDRSIAPAPQPPTLDAAVWQHIHRVLADCEGNVSEAARLLGMHRSRLRRWLARQAPRC